MDSTQCLSLRRSVGLARATVCEKTFAVMTAAPYAGELETVLPPEPVDLAEAAGVDCSRTTPRHPRETKGTDHDVTTEANGPVCEGPECC